MRYARWIGLTALAVMLAVGAAPVYAQTGARADIKFPFEVSGKILPAGTYEFEMTSPAVLMVRSVTDPKATSQTLVLTRLAEGTTPLAGPEVVFDKAGDRTYLSEFWMPGEDGYLVLATKGTHSHARVKATKK